MFQYKFWGDLGLEEKKTVRRRSSQVSTTHTFLLSMSLLTTNLSSFLCSPSTMEALDHFNPAFGPFSAQNPLQYDVDDDESSCVDQDFWLLISSLVRTF